MKIKNLTHILQLTGVLLIVLAFTSCEKDIQVDVPKAEKKLVVEGSIEINDYARVFLTKNLPYFGTVDSTMLAQLIVLDAVVIVNDGSTYDTLKKVFNPDYFPPLFYQGTKLKGEIGKTYFLTVIDSGKTLTAATTIPTPIPLDSVWFKIEPHQDSLGYIWATFTDPAESGNYYRLFTKRLHKDKIFTPILMSIYDDKMFNGQSFQFSMMRGSNSLNSTTEDPEFGFFKLGDTIVVKACTIDKAHYDFWRTAEGEIYGGSNPFTTPTQIVTNIVGGGLGVWGGYGNSLYTIVAK